MRPDGRNSPDSTVAVVQRHLRLIALVLISFIVVTWVVSKSLDKVYETKSSLLVSIPAEAQSFDSVQASQSLARSYAEIARSRNTAERVAAELDDGTTAGDLTESVDVVPLSETLLLQIQVEDPVPERAQFVANTYASVFIDYTERSLADSTQARISLADPAPLPRSAAKPRPALYVAIAGLIGLAVGIALAFVLEQFDRRIRNIEDLEDRFDLPVLGKVPVRSRSEHAFREAFRILRANLQLVTGDQALRSVAITSPSRGEGKSTAAMQLAFAAVEVGLEVVLVEADMRNPMLASTLRAENDNSTWPGLSNFLVEAADLNDVVHQTTIPHLYLLPAGPPPPSPSSLLEVPRGKTIVSGLLEWADLVIFDTPAMAIGAESAIISTWVDGVLVVVDFERSTYTGLSHTTKQIEAVHARTLGLVVNKDKALEGLHAPYTKGSLDGPDARAGHARRGRPTHS